MPTESHERVLPGVWRGSGRTLDRGSTQWRLSSHGPPQFLHTSTLEHHQPFREPCTRPAGPSHCTAAREGDVTDATSRQLQNVRSSAYRHLGCPSMWHVTPEVGTVPVCKHCWRLLAGVTGMVPGAGPTWPCHPDHAPSGSSLGPGILIFHGTVTAQTSQACLRIKKVNLSSYVGHITKRLRV